MSILRRRSLSTRPPVHAITKRVYVTATAGTWSVKCACGWVDYGLYNGLSGLRARFDEHCKYWEGRDGP